MNGALYVWPLRGRARIASPFGPRRLRTEPAERLHAGVDLVAPDRTVVAVADGIVTHATRVYTPGFGGFGRVVALQLDESPFHALYAHLDRVDVAPGDRVSPGTPLGTYGRTGFSAADPQRMIGGGAHVHFEIATRPYPLPMRMHRVDPVQWLRDRDAGEVSSAPRRAAPIAGALVIGAALAWIFGRG